MKMMSTTYCKRFDSASYHQCIANWTAVIMLQVLIGHSGENRCEKIKTRWSVSVVTWFSWTLADGDGVVPEQSVWEQGCPNLHVDIICENHRIFVTTLWQHFHDGETTTSWFNQRTGWFQLRANTLNESAGARMPYEKSNKENTTISANLIQKQ